MAAITWQNVVDFFAAQSAVPLDAQTAILAHVNTALSVTAFGGEDDPQTRLARIYYAAHFGEIATPDGGGADVSSKTVSKDSLTIAYDTGTASAEELAATTGGALFLALSRGTPARVGFVCTNPGS